MSDSRHLARYLHDVTTQITETWCEASGSTMNATEHIDEATCLECLNAASNYGRDARARWMELHSKL